MPSSCELCDAVRMTTWWHDDDVCWIAECESCSVPMVVWKIHATEPPDEAREHMLARLRVVAEEHGPPASWIDERSRTILGHYHAHARRRAFG